MSITTCTFAEGGPTVGTNAVTNYKIDGGTAVELDNPGDMGNEAEAGVTDDYPLLKASSAINVEMIGNGRHVETAAFCSATASAVSTRGTILASMLLPTRTPRPSSLTLTLRTQNRWLVHQISAVRDRNERGVPQREPTVSESGWNREAVDPG